MTRASLLFHYRVILYPSIHYIVALCDTSVTAPKLSFVALSSSRRHTGVVQCSHSCLTGNVGDKRATDYCERRSHLYPKSLAGATVMEVTKAAARPN